MGEWLLGQLLIQLFLEDLELWMGLSQLCLEPGNLLSVLLILSPERYNIISDTASDWWDASQNIWLKGPKVAVFFNQANAHTVVCAIHSAELWPGPLWPAGPSWSLTAPAWLPYSAVYCGLLQPLLLPPKGHNMLLQPTWKGPKKWKKRKAASYLLNMHETIQLSTFYCHHHSDSYCTLCQANDLKTNI